jgi:diguanylate cyclase (GGDEF)-like protein
VDAQHWYRVAVIGGLVLGSWAIVAVVAMRATRRRCGGVEIDYLTGVVDVRGLLRHSYLAIAEAHRDHSPLSVAIFDLDRFRPFNVVMGREQGDQVLREYVAAWRPLLPPQALLTRASRGDFTLLMPGLDGAAALALVERLRAARPPRVSVSAGVAELGRADGVHHLRRKAEQALADAKRNGRDQAVLYSREGNLLEAELDEDRVVDPITGLPCYGPEDDRCLQRFAPAGWAALVVEVCDYLASTRAQGAEAGDMLMVESADRVLSVTSPYQAVVRRLRGPRFLVLVAEPEETIQALADRLVHSADRHHGLPGSLVVGGALSPRDGLQVPAVMRAAMTAATYAKRERLDGPAFFEDRMTEEARDRLAIGRALRLAIDRREIGLAFQPQLDLLDGSLAGVEVLARWHDPVLGAIGPEKFVRIAEELGLSKQLDRLVFERSLAQLRAWDDAGVPVPRVSVNISPATLAGRPFDVADLLAAYGVAPHRVTLELIESRLLDQVEGPAALRHFRDVGLRVSLDNFGTGYSSFGQLVSLPLDELKIDRSFLALDSEHHCADATVVEAIVRAGTALGLGVVAEGIETQAQLDLVRSLGCPCGQGFLLAHPLDAAELASWIDAVPETRRHRPAERKQTDPRR